MSFNWTMFLIGLIAAGTASLVTEFLWIEVWKLNVPKHGRIGCAIIGIALAIILGVL